MYEPRDLRREVFLTPDEVVLRYRGEVSLGTLRNWRSSGRGPGFAKVGRSVLYPLTSLEAWERERTSPVASNRS